MNDRPRSISARRKLLVASVGVATVSYAVLGGCGKDNVPTSGNLPSPPPSASVTPVSGNLPAPPPLSASPPPSASSTPISGNLPAPPPPTASGPSSKPKDGGK